MSNPKSRGSEPRGTGGAYLHLLLLIPVMMSMVLAGCGERARKSEAAGVLPDADAVAGLSEMGEIDEYEQDRLYDFLNGGAELYFDYDIVSVASVEYETAGDGVIEVSVYDMGGNDGAFGIYSSIRYPGADFMTVGNEGMLTASSLDFYKGRYYCRLVAFDSEPETQAAMIDLGKVLAGNIAEAGSPPVILGLLPTEHRVKRSEKYFTGPIALNNVRYISNENVLRLGEGTEGVAAAYDVGGTAFTAFLIRYASETEAGAALESYRAHMGDAAGAVAERRGRYLAGIWDSGGAPAAVVLESLLDRLEEQQ